MIHTGDVLMIFFSGLMVGNEFAVAAFIHQPSTDCPIPSISRVQ